MAQRTKSQAAAAQGLADQYNLGARTGSEVVDRLVFEDDLGQRGRMPKSEEGKATLEALHSAAESQRSREGFGAAYGGGIGGQGDTAANITTGAEIYQDFLGPIRGAAFEQTAAPAEWAARKGAGYSAAARGIPDDPNVNRQRMAAMAARGAQANALELMRQRAMGRNLVSDQMAAAQQERVGNQMLSAASSGRGGYDPAAFRAAAMAGGQAGAQIGQQAQISAMQEQMAAEQALAQGAGAMRGADLGAMGQEGQLQLGSQSLAQQGDLSYDTLGLGASQADRASLQALEQLRLQQRQAALQSSLGQYTARSGKGGAGSIPLIGGAIKAGGDIISAGVKAFGG